MTVEINRMNGHCREPLTSSKTHTFVPEKNESYCAAGICASRPRILTERSDEWKRLNATT